MGKGSYRLPSVIFYRSSSEKPRRTPRNIRDQGRVASRVRVVLEHSSRTAQRGHAGVDYSGSEVSQAPRNGQQNGPAGPRPPEKQAGDSRPRRDWKQQFRRHEAARPRSVNQNSCKLEHAGLHVSCRRGSTWCCESRLDESYLKRSGETLS